MLIWLTELKHFAVFFVAGRCYYASAEIFFRLKMVWNYN